MRTVVWTAIWYRRRQALWIAALSGLVVACAAFATLYDRALTQALLRVGLGQVSATSAGLTLTSASLQDPSSVATPQQLRALVPGSVLRVSLPPIQARDVELQVHTGPHQVSLGTANLVAADGMCPHLQLPTGRCPTTRGDVVVSAADAALHHWVVGSRLRVSESVPNVDLTLSPNKTLTVVGSYVPLPGDFWSWTSLTGRSGTLGALDSGRPIVQLDSWLTSGATMDGPRAVIGRIRPDGTRQLSTGTTDPHASWMAARSWLVVPADAAALDVDSVETLNRRVLSLQARTPSRYSVEVSSSLPSIVAQLDSGRAQARVIVPLLSAQLGVLAVVVLRLVLGAAVVQRRQEVALTRLRGGGSRAAQRALVAELGTAVLLGVVPGVLAAVLLSALARHVWLVPGVPFEMPTTAVLAACAAAVLALAMVVLAARSTTREPIASLLRRVPARGERLRLGLVDIAVVAVAGAAVLALASSAVPGPLALATPALLALAVGLLLARLCSAAAAFGAQRAMRGGHVTAGLTALQLTRRPGVRAVVTVLTVAVALVVFATDAFVVAGRNREVRAEVQVGAPLVVSVTGSDIEALRAATLSADPGGTRLTPVAEASAGGVGAVPTLAVLPAQFARIALFPGSDPAHYPWAALALPRVLPLRLRGGTLSVTVRGIDVTQPPGQVGYDDRGRPLPLPRTAATLSVHLVDAGGQRTSVQVGQVPFGRTGPTTLRAAVPCEISCGVVGLSLRSSGSAQTEGSFLVSRMTTERSGALRIGGVGDWLPLPPNRDGDRLHASPAPGHAGELLVDYVDASAQEIGLQHASTGDHVPALTAGPLPSGSAGPRFQGTGLDGLSQDMVRAGTLPYGPGVGAQVTVVNLELLQRGGSQQAPAADLQVWCRNNDPALLRSLSTSLQQHGLAAAGTMSVASLVRAYSHTASAWGLQLALLVAAAALLIAALMLAVSISTTSRQRGGDLAALVMSGVPRPVVRASAVTEQLVLVAVSGAAGTLSGLLGARLALPLVPLFTTAPTVDLTNLSPAWAAVAVGAIVSLGTLLAVGAAVGAGLARRSSFSLLNEPL